ncbi:MAG: ATP-binding cassette domain-containing protein [Mariprofundaceae bacterium]|nr:ATP-binding cassette domain-containing protein [Mariprofundaceae bacterium]
MNTLQKNMCLEVKSASEEAINQDSVLNDVELAHVSLTLSGKHILKNISFALPNRGITSLIGPSGAGKSSLLRCLTLLCDHWQGDISIQGSSIRRWSGGEDHLRRHIGLIAQKPSVFPTSIYENVIFGLSRKERGKDQSICIEASLRMAALWDEVHDRLHTPANNLSIGQQQRLCLARALILKPKVLLLDEPTASLDPRSKQLIEISLHDLAKDMPLLCVTHDLEQAQRLQGQVIFMCDGKIIEKATAKDFFQHPSRIESREFLRWSVCDCG